METTILCKSTLRPVWIQGFWFIHEKFVVFCSSWVFWQASRGFFFLPENSDFEKQINIQGQRSLSLFAITVFYLDCSANETDLIPWSLNLFSILLLQHSWSIQKIISLQTNYHGGISFVLSVPDMHIFWEVGEGGGTSHPSLHYWGTN